MRWIRCLRSRGPPERLAAIRRDKIAMGTVEFEKVTTPEPDQQTILDTLGGEIQSKYDLQFYFSRLK
jgi:hypothetical protein